MRNYHQEYARWRQKLAAVCWEDLLFHVLREYMFACVRVVVFTVLCMPCCTCVYVYACLSVRMCACVRWLFVEVDVLRRVVCKPCI
jgi:hypothetical protein